MTRMPSRIAVLLMVIDIPSTASNRPARVPSSVDRNSRRPARATITTVTTPHSAVASRHPAGSMPSSLMPPAMSHFPTVGMDNERGAVGEHVEVAVEDLVIGAVDERSRVTEAQERERVLGVVGLVEDELRRPPEVDEPQYRCDGTDEQWAEPAPHAVLGIGRTSRARTAAAAETGAGSSGGDSDPTWAGESVVRVTETS